MVHAVSQQIAPEAVRLVGIIAIMLTQNWRMSLVAVCMLPPYMWLARRTALRMRSNLDPYYQLWEDISGHIADSIGAVKTVKLSGAEDREERRLQELQRIEDKNAKKTPEEKEKDKNKKPVELGSADDFMLTQAVAFINGQPVKRSSSKLE